MTKTEREFMFDGMAVGIFEGPGFPRSPGRYRYEPYRGPGHYEMQTRLRSGQNPRCYYDCDDIRVSFIVSGCPEYGVLELYDFESSQHQSVERTGMSRSAQRKFQRQWWLIPIAHLGRSANVRAV